MIESNEPVSLGFGRGEFGVIRFPAVRKAILANKPAIICAAWTISGVIAATAVRWLIDRGEAGVPFVTYFPVVVLASLFLGWRWATIAALLSAVAANRIFRPGHMIFDFGSADFIMAGLFILSCAILINIGEVLRRLLQDLDTANEREALLNGELRHRVRNLLAVIQSVAVITHKKSDPDTFLESFSSRVAAMARVTEIADARETSERSIERLVETAVAPFRNATNFAMSGPQWEVPQKAFMPLALALHELCTNAVKYGALSHPTGSVVVEWELDNRGKRLTLMWREAGGPPVHAPDRQGMGSLLLRPQKGVDDLRLEFLPQGVECTITIAAK